MLAAFAPATLQAEPASQAVALHQATPSPSSPFLRRLIVKYKDNTTPRAAQTSTLHPRVPDGQERAIALNAADYRSGGGRHALRLSLLKSITAQSHVMVSNTPLTRAEMTALTQSIAQDPQVEYAEIDERAYPLMAPNDTDYATRQWNLKAQSEVPGGINVPGAWDLTVGGLPVNGAGVTVAVVDTGFRPHPDLLANMVPGYDFISMDTDGSFTSANDGDGRDADAQDPGDWNPVARIAPDEPCDASDSTWHGTRVAGIIGAATNNNTGIAGIAYGATLLPVRVLGRCGGYVSDIAAGIQWAAGLPVSGAPRNTAHVAKVINVSIGSTGECSATFQNAITAARNAGSVIVVATGNQGNQTIDSPANCTGVIAVTAHTRLGDSADYANIGPGTHISAPGGGYGIDLVGDGSSIYTTSNTGHTTPDADNYSANASGTSFAAPQVAAVAALLFQIRPTISPDGVLSYLRTYARPYPARTYCATRANCGAGMLDAQATTAALLASQTNSNHPPVMAPVPAQTVAAGATLQFTVSATDADGDRVSFSANGLPSGASLDSSSGVFLWANTAPGVYNVTITPIDGSAPGTAIVVRITVTGTVVPTGTAGGGGGATGLLDAIGTLLLACGAWALRRSAPLKDPVNPDCQQATGHTG